MNNTRYHHSIAAIGPAAGIPPACLDDGSIRGGIVVVGGINGRCYLKLVQRLNFSTGKWGDIPPVKTGRALHTSCTLGERTVLAIGGSNLDPESSLPPIDRINLDKDSKWTSINLLKYPAFLDTKGKLKAVPLNPHSFFLFG